MERITKLLTIFLIIAMFVFTSTLGLTVGGQNRFSETIGSSQGIVRAFSAGILIVEFSDPVINSCGDTRIYGFVTTPDDFTLQLKPVFIPEAKALSVNDSVLVFPVWDVMPFLQKEGAYTLEYYVENNCSIFHNKTITLKPVAMVLTAEGGLDV